MLLLIGEEDDEIVEDLVHHRLEGCRGIGKAKEHHQGFIQSPVSYKGSLPLITGFDLDIIVSPSDVKLCEERSTAKLVYHFGDQRQRIAVFDDDRIQSAIILHGSKCPFLLFDEEEGG
ncbi:hypothetical protein IEO21_09977 [Rhodonia placenta]|uniref:Uncharacterized protein n=1 Tax=Rhodonia placenta TaxID=104341 RepID=A0A8H7NTB8_9APHY|nr:hypothetical protein IEO21_09977 [Postia placenta]